MSTDFDRYTDDYRAIIDRVARLSGGTYDYFVELRLNLILQKLAARSLKAPRSILDFGCGIGATALIMRRSFPEAHIIGVDTSAESISAATALGVSNAEFRCIPAGDSLIDAAAFDLIYTNGTFHHIDPSARARVVSELKTVLQDDGNLFVFENNPRNPLMMKAMRDNPFDEGVTAMAAAEIRRLLLNSGLTIHCQDYYAFFPTWSGPLRLCEPLLRTIPYGAQYLTWAAR